MSPRSEALACRSEVLMINKVDCLYKCAESGRRRTKAKDRCRGLVVTISTPVGTAYDSLL
jgi:hypothetical protein